MSKEMAINLNTCVLYRNIFINTYFKLKSFADKTAILHDHNEQLFSAQEGAYAFFNQDTKELTELFVIFLESLHAYNDIMNIAFAKKYKHIANVSPQKQHLVIDFFLELRNIQHHDIYIGPTFSSFFNVKSIKGEQFGNCIGIPTYTIRPKLQAALNRPRISKQKIKRIENSLKYIEKLEITFKENGQPIQLSAVIDDCFKAVCEHYHEFISNVEKSLNEKRNMKTILVDAFNTLVIKDHGINKEMHAMLEKYLNRKIILTNANEEQMQALGLVNLPYEMFTLKHDPEKTDPKYFQIMLEHFGLSKEDVIYFEHNEDAVKSAQSIGIKTFHYDKDKKDLVALKNFVDVNL